MAHTKTVGTLERARDAFVDIRDALENKTGESLDEIAVEQYDDIIEAIPSGEPVLDTLTVTPSTSSQTITPSQGVDGFDEVNVDAVDNSIDSNIVAGNIKKDVEILGVTGTYDGGQPNLQSKEVTPSVNTEVITPDTGYDALSQVIVYGDEDLNAYNIKKDVEIFGVTGVYEGDIPTYQQKIVTPSTSLQTIRPDSGYDALDEVYVQAVNSDIDPNIVAGNIKKGISILGVAGSIVTEMIPEFEDSNPKTAVMGGLPFPESEELRALLKIDNVIHLFCNGNHYTFDDEESLTWTLVDSDTKFCGKDASSNIDDIDNAAVLIGRYVVWVGIGVSGFQSICYYNVDTKVVGNYINLGAPTGFISCIATDGEFLYMFDRSNNKLRKVAIDFTNGTATATDVVTGFTNKILGMGFLNGKLYGYDDYSGQRLYEIDIANGTFTKVSDLDSSVTGGKNRMFVVTDDAIFIGSGGNMSMIYKWDGTSLTTYGTYPHGTYSGKSAWCVLKGKLYMYGYRTSVTMGTYTSIFGIRATGVGEHLVIEPSNVKQEFNNKLYYTKIIVNPAS